MAARYRREMEGERGGKKKGGTYSVKVVLMKKERECINKSRAHIHTYRMRTIELRAFYSVI